MKNILLFGKDPYLMWTLAVNIRTYANLIKEEACVDEVTSLEGLEKRLRGQDYSAVVVTTPGGVKTAREKKGKNENVPLYFLVDRQQNSSGLVREALASGATICIYNSPLLNVGGGMDRILKNIFNDRNIM